MRVGGDAIPALCWQTLDSVLAEDFVSVSRPAVAAVTAVGDLAATRIVYTSVVALVLLGIVLAALAVWVTRRTQPDLELFAPLETMQTRGWRKLDPAAQRRSLDESRPFGARPLRREASEPKLDSSFAILAPVSSFDDLSEGAPPEADADTDTEVGNERTCTGQGDDTDPTLRIDRPGLVVEQDKVAAVMRNIDPLLGTKPSTASDVN